MAKSEKFSPLVCEPNFAIDELVTTIIEAILDGKYPEYLMMKDLMEPFPVDWYMQGKIFLQPK